MQVPHKHPCFISDKDDNLPMRGAILKYLYIPLAALIVSACTPASETVHETRFMMGTLVDFTLYDANKENAAMAIKAAADEMQRVENLFTIYGDGDNPVKQFNASEPGTPVELPEEIDNLLNLAMQIDSQSHHGFSITLASLNKLWGFSLPTPPTSPPTGETVARLTRLSSNCLQQLPNHRWKRIRQECQLDFGAIAKGYAIDRGIMALKESGIGNAIINAGGDIRVIGRHGERPWQVGIRHPRKSGEVIATLKVEGDVSIVTSGDYERFYIFDDVRYHHILNPTFGQPARKSQSATVIADHAAMADGWSTALFVMGETGIESIEKRGMDAILVDANGKIHTTKDIESRLQLSLSAPMLRTSD